MIPAMVYPRLVHRPLQPQKATAALAPAAEKSLAGNPPVRYELNLPGAQRRASTEIC